MLRLAVRAPAEHSEQVLAAMIELAPAGFEECDEGEVVEYAVYGAPGELPELARDMAVVGGIEVEVRCELVADDWAERWKRFHRPVTIGSRLHVRPPWEQAPVRDGLTEVVIDPGAAFGTGTHPTTRLCLELMLELEPAGEFCDLGCGSGILAIAAAKLGWEPVRAYDADRQALAATAHNTRENAADVEVERVDLRNDQAPVAPTVAANLTTGLLEIVAANWLSAKRCPEHFVASGLLDSEVERVERAYAQLGLDSRRTITLGEWGACLFTRAGEA